MDWVKAGKTEFPPILLGTSPFYGLDQFGEKKVSEYARKFDKVEVLAEIIKQAIKTGVEGAHMGSPEIRHLPLWDGHVLPPIYEAFELADCFFVSCNVQVPHSYVYFFCFFVLPQTYSSVLCQKQKKNKCADRFYSSNSFYKG